MAGVSLEYAAPETALRDHVSVLYEFCSDLPQFADDDRADLAQLRFQLSGSGRYRFADGHEQEAPAVQIVGPTTGVTHIAVDGPARVVGAGVLPLGWAAMIGIDASTLVNRVLDARELLCPHLIGDTLAALRSAESFQARGTALTAFIQRLITPVMDTSCWFIGVVDDWLATCLDPQIDDLVAASSLSRRQVERLCKRLYGAPPKLLARKYRALRGAVVLAKGEMTPAELLTIGFYDQSHCIREIKRFTGVTPTRIPKRLNDLTRLTMQRTAFAGELAPLVVEA